MTLANPLVGELDSLAHGVPWKHYTNTTLADISDCNVITIRLINNSHSIRITVIQ